MGPVYIARVFDARVVLINSACGERVSATTFCRWGVVRVRLSFALPSMWLGGWLSRRVSRLAARGSHLDHRGEGSRVSEGRVVGPSGGLDQQGSADDPEEGALTVGSDASAAPLCRRGWCSGGVCEFGSRSGRVTADVVGRLVFSPGLEARRTRLAPRPAREGQSVIGGRRLDQREGTPRPSGGGTTTIGRGTPRPSIRGAARPTGGQSGRAARRFFSASTSKSAAGQSRSRPVRASMSSSQIARRENHFRLAGMRYHGVASESQRSKIAW